MKKVITFKTLIATIAFMVLSSIGMTSSFAATYMVTGVDANDNLNVRSGPGANYDVITVIPSNGTSIGSTDEESTSGNNTWIKISWQGMEGWVNKRYLIDMSGYTYPNLGKSTNQKKYYDYQSNADAAVNDANTHTHPAIPGCTNSVTHTHPNGANPHQHRYSCQGMQSPQRVAPTPVTPVSADTHTHPAVPGCTNSITHTHPNGANTHNHNYSCKPNQVTAPTDTRIYNKSGQVANLPNNLNYAEPSYEVKTKVQPKVPNYLQ